MTKISTAMTINLACLYLVCAGGLILIGQKLSFAILLGGVRGVLVVGVLCVALSFVLSLIYPRLTWTWGGFLCLPSLLWAVKVAIGISPCGPMMLAGFVLTILVIAMSCVLGGLAGGAAGLALRQTTRYVSGTSMAPHSEGDR